MREALMTSTPVSDVGSSSAGDDAAGEGGASARRKSRPGSPTNPRQFPTGVSERHTLAPSSRTRTS
jgi:hypothetical protein